MKRSFGSKVWSRRSLRAVRVRDFGHTSRKVLAEQKRITGLQPYAQSAYEIRDAEAQVVPHRIPQEPHDDAG